MSDNPTDRPRRQAADKAGDTAASAPQSRAAPAGPARDDPDMKRARYRNSRGAQVILDPESDASLGARGGAAGTIEENTQIRDRHLASVAVNPRDPDASHLPGNIVPGGGEVRAQVPDEHAPVWQPPDAPEPAAKE